MHIINCTFYYKELYTTEQLLNMILADEIKLEKGHRNKTKQKWLPLEACLGTSNSFTPKTQAEELGD